MASPQITMLQIAAPDKMNYIVGANAGPTIDDAPASGPRLLFTAANNHLAMSKIIPCGNYVAGGAIILKVEYTMAVATTGTVVLACDVDCKTPGSADNANAEDYDTVNTSDAQTVADAVTKPMMVSVAIVNRDGMALGDEVRVRWGFTSAGSATGLIQARMAWLEFTPA